jgi:hypothetical protein
VGAALGVGVTARTTLAVALLVVLGATAGCATPAGKTPESGSAAKSSPSAPASPTASPMFTPTAPAGTPLGSGERVWAAFSNRSLAYDAWWAQLKPLLSEAAQAVYVYDDPSKIPAMKPTGKIHLAAKAPDQPRYTVEVLVPTDKGQWGLDLERRTLTSKWLLYAIKFPPGVH